MTQLTFPELDYLERFTIPVHNYEEEDKALNLFSEKFPTLLNHVVVIGKYQPLHYGHVYLFKQAINIAESITIGIGSANIHTTDNPFSPEEREYMIRKALDREGRSEFVEKIVYLDDDPDDEIWFKNAIKKIGRVDGIVGNNDWVNGIFEAHKIPAYSTPSLDRDMYEGKKIREKLREEGKI